LRCAFFKKSYLWLLSSYRHSEDRFGKLRSRTFRIIYGSWVLELKLKFKVEVEVELQVEVEVTRFLGFASTPPKKY
jgi:hypothetical protein